MKRKEKATKARGILQNLLQLLSFVQWVIAVICLPGTTIIVVVIMPAINLLVAFLLGIGITIIVVFMAIFYNYIKKKLDIEQARLDIEQARRKDEMPKKPF